MKMTCIYLCTFVSVSASMGTLPAWLGVICAFVWGFMACNEKWKATLTKSVDEIIARPTFKDKP